LKIEVLLQESLSPHPYKPDEKAGDYACRFAAEIKCQKRNRADERPTSVSCKVEQRGDQKSRGQRADDYRAESEAERNRHSAATPFFDEFPKCAHALSSRGRGSLSLYTFFMRGEKIVKKKSSAPV
jgi:hypothetical protein